MGVFEVKRLESTVEGITLIELLCINRNKIIVIGLLCIDKYNIPINTIFISYFKKI